MFLLSPDYWEVRETHEKGKGVFARKDILPGTVIGDYLGKLFHNSEDLEAKFGLYDMGFNDDYSIFPDLESTGIHLINHSCSPNCDMSSYHGHALYFASRYIFAREELTVQYSLQPPEKDHVCNHVCYCYSPVCHGTMHTSITVAKQIDEYVKKTDGKYMVTPPVKEGEVVPPLEKYPVNIKDDPMNDLFGCLSEKTTVHPDRVLPSVKEIRQLIRKEGRMLEFPYMNIKVFGIMNGLIVCLPES